MSGPTPPRPGAGVFWVRRAVTLVALVLIVALVWWIVRMLFGSNDVSVPASPANPSSLAFSKPTTAASTPAASSSASHPASAASSPASSPASPASSASSAPAKPVDCQPGAVTVRPQGSTSVRSGTPTTISVVFTNGPTACRLDFAATPLTLVITSGTDRIWSSEDCSQWAPRGTHDFKAGEAWTFKVEWPTLRSAANCTIRKDYLQPGTYVATSQLGSAGQRAQLVMQLRK